jgi:hypothetical protein
MSACFDRSVALSAHAALGGTSFVALRARCPEARVAADLEDYRRFLALKVAAQDWHASLISPPVLVDLIWHSHLLDTLAYEEACKNMGVPQSVRVIHHNPDGGLDAGQRAARRQRALQYYRQAFGTPPGGNWGDDRKRAAPPAAAAAAAATDRKRAAQAVKQQQPQDEGGGRPSGNAAAQREAGPALRAAAAPAPAVAAATMSIVVVSQDGSECLYKCTADTPLQKLMTAYCSSLNLGPYSPFGRVRFLFDGKKCGRSQTPQGLQMKDGDVIDVVREPKPPKCTGGKGKGLGAGC